MNEDSWALNTGQKGDASLSRQQNEETQARSEKEEQYDERKAGEHQPGGQQMKLLEVLKNGMQKQDKWPSWRNKPRGSGASAQGVSQ